MAEVSAALLGRYGATLGEQGAGAVAAAAVKGAGKLGWAIARNIWLMNLGIAALIGAIGALLALHSIAQDYDAIDARAHFLTARSLTGWTMAIGLIWAVAAHWVAQYLFDRKKRNAAPGLQLRYRPALWSTAGGLTAFLATAAILGGSIYGSWRYAIPAIVRDATDRQMELTGGSGPRFELPAETPIHAWPRETSPLLATLEKGAAVRVATVRAERTPPEWTFVSANSYLGYVPTAALEGAKTAE